MLGAAIKEAREIRGITQKQLAINSYLSDKTISAIETGRREVNLENLSYICDELEDPRVYFEAVNEICNGVFSIHWLDGEAADLHRASVKEKIIEELSEAIRAINLAKVYKSPGSCNQDDIRLVKESISETIDVYSASAIYIAVMCREYGINIRSMFDEQKNKLIQRGYIKEEK
jgi:transcriptional regulator with XRE-family HTH domain